MVDGDPKLGARPEVDKDDPNYDEYRASQPLDKLQKDTFKYMKRRIESYARMPLEAREELLQEIEDDLSDEEREEMLQQIEDGFSSRKSFLMMKEMREELEETDPIMAFMLEQFMVMSPAERGLIEKVAARRKFSGAETQAFVDMIMGVDFRAIDEVAGFKLSYLQMVMGSMRPRRRVDFMVNMMSMLPVGNKQSSELETAVVGRMKALGFVSEDEVEKYLRSSESLESKTNLKEDVDKSYERVFGDIELQESRELEFSSSAYDGTLKSDMDRKYELNDLMKGGGLFVAGMTLFVNASGVVGALVVNYKDPAKGVKAAIDHVKNHHYVLPAILGIAGFSRSLTRGDRPIREAIMPGDRRRLGTLIDSGVGRDSIRQMRDESIYHSTNAVLDSMNSDRLKSIRSGHNDDIFTEMSDVIELLKNKGKYPNTKGQQREMLNEMLEIGVSLRGWDYWNFRTSDKLLRYCEKKYTKVEKANKMIAEDEAEEAAEEAARTGTAIPPEAEGKTT
ncbi:hypothetical protein HOG48_04900 [Candidatus Peregrinibacteria bacterium]|jgi:hypothetical protein|nr:hypothetical protein [Candidatus Peregrinibacteria bacterium]